jgi:uncharacterized protein (TIGR02996 family)
MEDAFLDAIVAHPADDVHRLVFADWLEENGQEQRAELIRLQCRLEPLRDFFEDAEINKQHARVCELLRVTYPDYTAPERAEWQWFARLSKEPQTLPSPDLEWRRGFVETMAIYAASFVRHGAALRRRYPLLRKLVVFGLNGWGERLAECKALAGLPEVELACWYSDRDAQHLAQSRHLRAVERLVCYSGGGLHQAEILARGSAWPNLHHLHLIAAFDEHEGWAEAVDAAARRRLATVYRFDQELYPFAADFYDSWTEWISAGKLPNGTQLILNYVSEPAPGMARITYDENYDPSNLPVVVSALAFDADGTPRPEPFRVPLPQELWWKKAYPTAAEQQSLFIARMDYLRRTLGFEPAMIRVRDFDAEAWLGRTERFWEPDHGAEWGEPDEATLEADFRDPCHGRTAYHWVRQGCFGLEREGDRITFTRAGRSDGDSFVPW